MWTVMNWFLSFQPVWMLACPEHGLQKPLAPNQLFKGTVSCIIQWIWLAFHYELGRNFSYWTKLRLEICCVRKATKLVCTYCVPAPVLSLALIILCQFLITLATVARPQISLGLGSWVKAKSCHTEVYCQDKLQQMINSTSFSYFLWLQEGNPDNGNNFFSD